MDQSVEKRVCATVADIFGLDPGDVSASTSPDDVPNWDSLQHLNLVLALEQEFEVQFTPEEMAELISVELITLLIEEKQA